MAGEVIRRKKSPSPQLGFLGGERSFEGCWGFETAGLV
jgi:hypothetical protein